METINVGLKDLESIKNTETINRILNNNIHYHLINSKFLMNSFKTELIKCLEYEKGNDELEKLVDMFKYIENNYKKQNQCARFVYIIGSIINNIVPEYKYKSNVGVMLLDFTEKLGKSNNVDVSKIINNYQIIKNKNFIKPELKSVLNENEISIARITYEKAVGLLTNKFLEQLIDTVFKVAKYDSN